MSGILEKERTISSDIPLGHLEYDYIGKCKDPKELEKIIKVLRSGEEGRYPDLENFAEERLTVLNPKSRSLRKEHRVSTPADLDKSEWEAISGDLSNWTNQMKNADGKHSETESIAFDDDDPKLPPVRGRGTIAASKQHTSSAASSAKGEKAKKNKRVKPRDYKEWDKVDVEAELEKIADEEKPESKKGKEATQTNVLSKPSKPSIPSRIDSTDLSHAEKELKSEQEKNKGNEAFRASDFQEALLYYDRSLSLFKSVAVHNNRAQCYLKLKEWDNAIEDCQTVLNLDPTNLKGLLRRAVAYQGKKHFVNAKNDIQKVLEMDPGNKRATSIFKEIEEAINEQKAKGRRMVIEETDGSSESEGEDQVNTSQHSPQLNGSHVNTSSAALAKTENKESRTVEEVTPKEQASKQQKAAEKQAKPDKQKEAVTKKDKSDTALPDNKAPNKPDQSASNTSKKNKKRKKKYNRNQADSVSGPQEPVIESDPAPEDNQKPETQTEIKVTSSNSAPLEEAAPATQGTPAEECAPVAEPAPVEEPAPEPPAPLPEKVSLLKATGNDLFKVGQYGEAIVQYSKAIDELANAKGNHSSNMHLLYGNRGLSKLKVGDCEGCVRDCNTALELQPGSIKPLARRAQAFETMEKFRRAYVDYRQVVFVDSSIEVAQQGLNRCMKMLQEADGPKWREKLPDVKVSHLIQSSQPTATGRPTSTIPSPDTNESFDKPQQTRETKSKTSGSSTAAPKVPELTKDELYDKHKNEGNAFVQKGDFNSAIDCYSHCIEISREKSVAFVNRALCYLRLNKPKEVVSDCDEGLKLDPVNIKALFRRAQGYKMLENYDESYHDLTSLLKKDPKNPAARRELLVVMKYRDQAMKAKAQKQQEEEEKKRHRMKIQEVSDSDSSDEDFKPSQKGKKSPASTGTKSKDSPKSKQESAQSKSKSGKGKAATEAHKEKKSSTDTHKDKKHMAEPQKEKKPAAEQQTAKKQTPAESSKDKKGTSPGPKNVLDLPDDQTKDKKSAKPSKSVDKGSEKETSKDSETSPKLSNVTAYEFVKSWMALRGKKDVAPYAKLLDQIEPENLPKVISNKLDAEMLHMLIRSVETFIDKGELSRSLAYLQNLTTVPRFNMVTMFMGKQEEKDLEKVLTKLSEGATCPLLQEDLKKLRKAYEM